MALSTKSNAKAGLVTCPDQRAYSWHPQSPVWRGCWHKPASHSQPGAPGHPQPSSSHVCSIFVQSSSQPLSDEKPGDQAEEPREPRSGVGNENVFSTCKPSNPTLIFRPLPSHTTGKIIKGEKQLSCSPQGWGVLIFPTLINSSQLQGTITQGPLRTPSTLGPMEPGFLVEGRRYCFQGSFVAG